MNTIQIDKDDYLDFVLQLKYWLPSGDTISTVVFEVSNQNIVVDNISNTTQQIQYWLRASESGTLTLRVTTTEGRIKDFTTNIEVVVQ